MLVRIIGKLEVEVPEDLTCQEDVDGAVSQIRAALDRAEAAVGDWPLRCSTWIERYDWDASLGRWHGPE